ncbi:MAG: hypothetical protein JWO76_880 [Nocardioides sp.]|nr:hypothetical protein [Nocardioides sp.]
MTGAVLAELSGNVWKVLRSVGDAVSANDTLLVIETMKMEIPVQAGTDGTVTELNVAPGDQVGEGDVLAVIAP